MGGSMSSVVLSGDTSGAITVAAPAVAGTNTLTLPAQTATLITDSSAALNIGSGQIYKDASGNVGIGTTSPTVRLHAYGSGTYVAGVESSSAYSYLGLRASGSGGSMADPTVGVGATVDNLLFRAGGAERMRTNVNGNFLIGTTTAPAVAQCAVNYSSNYWQYGASTTGSSIFWVLNSANTGVSLTSGNTSWAAQSDERNKDIIEPITDAANKVSTLRAVIGKYKTDEEGTRRSFLIAQDVQKVLPEVIDTDTDEQGTLSIRYSELTPLLVAAIQEQQAMIEELKNKVAALEAK